MTQVSFYTGVPDRLAYCCRLLRKAQQSGARVGVLAPSAMLERLDAALWSFEATEFVPHMRYQAGKPELMAATPLLLAERAEQLRGWPVLLNLGAEMPDPVEAFERVLEVLSRDPEQVQLGRQRFKRYKELGHQLDHHEVRD